MSKTLVRKPVLKKVDKFKNIVYFMFFVCYGILFTTIQNIGKISKKI